MTCELNCLIQTQNSQKLIKILCYLIPVWLIWFYYLYSRWKKGNMPWNLFYFPKHPKTPEHLLLRSWAYFRNFEARCRPIPIAAQELRPQRNSLLLASGGRKWRVRMGKHLVGQVASDPLPPTWLSRPIRTGVSTAQHHTVYNFSWRPTWGPCADS